MCIPALLIHNLALHNRSGACTCTGKWYRAEDEPMYYDQTENADYHEHMGLTYYAVNKTCDAALYPSLYDENGDCYVTLTLPSGG